MNVATSKSSITGNEAKLEWAMKIFIGLSLNPNLQLDTLKEALVAAHGYLTSETVGTSKIYSLFIEFLGLSIAKLRNSAFINVKGEANK